MQFLTFTLGMVAATTGIALAGADVVASWLLTLSGVGAMLCSIFERLEKE